MELVNTEIINKLWLDSPTGRGIGLKNHSVWVRIPLQLLFNYEECVCLKIGKKQKKVLGVVDTVGQDCETKRNMLEHLKSHPEYQRRENVNHTWVCQFCNQPFETRRKLYAHNKICAERLKLDTDSIGRIKNPIAQTNRLKSYNENRKAGIKINKPALTEEHKKSISEGTKNYLKKTIKHGGARYSFKACEFINKLNEEKGWNLQHAENGGEIRVDNYYLDGYDSSLNIAFEYDEKKHYNSNGELNEKDLKKMNYIKEKLNCRFFRYNESLNELKEF